MMRPLKTTRHKTVVSSHGRTLGFIQITRVSIFIYLLTYCLTKASFSSIVVYTEEGGNMHTLL